MPQDDVAQRITDSSMSTIAASLRMGAVSASVAVSIVSYLGARCVDAHAPGVKQEGSRTPSGFVMRHGFLSEIDGALARIHASQGARWRTR